MVPSDPPHYDYLDASQREPGDGQNIIVYPPLTEQLFQRLRQNRIPMLVVGSMMAALLLLGAAAKEKLDGLSSVVSSVSFRLEPEPSWLSWLVLGLALCGNLYLFDEALARRRLPVARSGPPQHRLGLLEMLLVFGFYYSCAACFQLVMLVCGVQFDAASVSLIALSLGVQALTLGFALFVARCNQISLAKLGLDRQHLKAGLRAGCVGFFLVFPVMFYLMVLGTGVVGHALQIKPQDHPLAEALAGGFNRWELLLAFGVASIGAPIVEELIFRGFLYQALRRGFGARWGILVSALIFASAHSGFYHYGPIFVLGVLFAWLYERTGQLWAPMLAHFLHNSLQLILFLSYG